MNETKWQIMIKERFRGKPDVIMLSYTLHHLSGVENFIKKISSWINKEKYLLINEENPLSPLFRLKHIIRSFLQKDTDSEEHKTYSQWKKIITNDFKVLKPIGVDPIPLIGYFLPKFSWSYVF